MQHVERWPAYGRAHASQKLRIPPEHARACAGLVFSVLVRSWVERLQGSEHIVHPHRLGGTRQSAQLWRSLDRTGVRGPGCQDGALLLPGQARMPDDLGRMREHPPGAEQCIRMDVRGARGTMLACYHMGRGRLSPVVEHS